MSIDTVVDALTDKGCNPKGRNGQYQAKCPAHDDRNPSLSITEGNGKVLLCCHAGCTAERVVGALGLEASDLFDGERTPKTERKQDKKIVATYDYSREDGTVAFQAVRYEPKDFRQRVPDGRGNYTWNLNDLSRCQRSSRSAHSRTSKLHGGGQLFCTAEGRVFMGLGSVSD